MKKIFSILIIICFTYACKSKDERLKEALSSTLKTYFTKVLKKDSITIDSIRIFKIDTLTQKKDSLQAFFQSIDRVGYLQESVKKQLNVIQSAMKIAQLSANISEELYKQDFAIVLDERKKLEGINLEYKTAMKNMERLNTLIAGKKLDSTTFKGYIVSLNVKGHNYLNVAKNLDSLSITLNPDKQIIER
jgi:hypothetical protein